MSNNSIKLRNIKLKKRLIRFNITCAANYIHQCHLKLTNKLLKRFFLNVMSSNNIKIINIIYKKTDLTTKVNAICYKNTRAVYFIC